MRAEPLGKWLAVVTVAWLATGCATLAPLHGSGGASEPASHVPRATTLQRGSGGSQPLAGEDERLRRRRSVRMPAGTAVDVGDMGVLAVETGLLEVDAFEKLLVYAGLDPTGDLPPRVNPLTPDDAARVLALLLQKPVTLGNFPPRMAAAWLLREVLEGGEVSREELLRRVERFARVAVPWGAASATTRTLGGLRAGAEATVPVLSLSAEGALMMERIAVPVGQAATVLRGGPGAAIILHRANTAAGESSSPGGAGPGKWEDANESMSEASRKYQAQVTEAPEGKVYEVRGVRFDGFKVGVLLETKGPGYARFLKDGSFRAWFRGADGMLEQARRQLKAANGTPIQWHFAEREVADAVRDLFRNEGIGRIKVVYTPPSL